MKAAVSSVDQTLPPRQMFVLGLQHLAVSYIGIITVPLIIASALKLSQVDAVILIGATIFFSGIATLLQTVGFWKFGVKLPILQGVAFSSVGPVIAIGSNPSMGLAGVCGAVIVAGVFTMIAAPVSCRLCLDWGRLRRGHFWCLAFPAGCADRAGDDSCRQSFRRPTAAQSRSIDRNCSRYRVGLRTGHE